MEIIIALAVVGLLVLFFIAQYNRLIRLNISVDESFAQIEVQLKRRSDLIPNLVETVKGYAAHEQGTFDAVVTASAKATTASGVADVAAADGMLTQALSGLLAVAEAYQISKHHPTSYLYKKNFQQLKIKLPSHVSSTTTMFATSTPL